jgi:TonB-linked SusC/RagA family outer membrane protein
MFFYLSKPLLIMKLTTVIVLAACLQVSARSTAQISLSRSNTPLQKIFKELQKQSGYDIFYTYEIVQQAGNISVQVKNVSIQQALDACLKNTNLSYQIIDKTVVIKEKKAPLVETGTALPRLENVPPPVNIDVAITVLNSEGLPLEGASVFLKGQNKGIATDINGRAILKNADPNATIIISFAGFQNQEIKIADRNSIIVRLVARTNELEEVVINKGYYTEKQRLNPGNISKITAKDIEKNPVSNPLAALEGRVPGLEIIQQTGVPGGGFKVRIRGTNSIASGNDPLYIVNGVPFISTSLSVSTGLVYYGEAPSPLNSVNPADIESIEVLKDADALAIYGSRGANGVILITTKQGKPGKTKVEFNSYTGTGAVQNNVKQMNLRQYLDMRREAFKNDNTIPTTANAPDLLVWDTTRSTDWHKELIGGKATYTDAMITVSGGEKNTQFSIAGGYHKETTVFPGDNADKKINVHASIANTSSDQRFKTSLLADFSSNLTNLPGADLTPYTLNLAPNAPPLYDSIGNLSWKNWSQNNENPLANLKRPYEQVTNTLRTHLLTGYAIIPGLEIRLSAGYTSAVMSSILLKPIASQFPFSGVQNISSFGNSKFQNWIVEPQVNWIHNAGKGIFNVLIGSTFEEQVREGLSQTAAGFSSEALMKNLSAATTRTIGTNYFTQYRYSAIFGKVNYTFDQKYVINLTGRRDGSSRFGPGKQFGNFGAIGTAWIFSREGFIEKKMPFISYGKLRASYGTAGKDQIGDYQYLDSYSPSTGGTYQGNAGLTPVRLSNPDFAWEISKKFEAAIELGILKDRILFNLSYFNNRSSSQLIGFPLSPATGFSSIQANFPATVQNTGLEIELTTRNIITKNFNWTSSFNISIPKNKLVAFPDMEKFSAYANTYVVGEPLSISKRYHFTGINTTTGLYEFQDVDANGSFDFRDQQVVRFIGQKFYGGLQNSFQYKGFQLDVFFQFVKQTGLGPYPFTAAGAGFYTEPEYMLDRWRTAGDKATYQRFGTSSAATTAAARYAASDAFITDGSFIRLKNLSLSWNLPAAWLSKIHAADAKLFIHGQNLLTFTNYKGLDPEIGYRASLPPLRVITAGIRLTF